MTIRNYCVARGSTPLAPGGGVYTVPANSSLILKAVSFSTPDINHYVLNLYAQAAGGGVQAILFHLDNQSLQAAMWEGWTVLNAGDEIQLNSNAPTFQYWIAGAVLPYATP